MLEDVSQQVEDEICAFSLMEHLGQVDRSILNSAEAVLHDLHWCTATVCADGFEGLLFDNLTADHVDEMICSAKVFGAKECAKLLHEAKSLASQRVARGALNAPERERLKRLTRAFSAVNDQEITWGSILAYVVRNQDAIRFSVSLDRERRKFHFFCRDKSLKFEG